MSYPRNAASPERVDIGAVIQISDGAVQTSGVAVKVIPQGASESSGGGTVGYSADGVVHYLPTQTETNYTSFILVASKTGCIPASKTVVTSASATAGYAGTDQAKIANPTSTVALSGTTIGTITTYTGNTPQTGDSFARIGVAGAGLTALATQVSVDDLPTNAELTTALGTADDAILTAVGGVQSDTNDIQSRLPAALESGRIAAVLDFATGTQITNIENAAGYTLAVLAGACADPQTASETYAITAFGSTFTVDMAGQTSTGVRTAPTLTKS